MFSEVLKEVTGIFDRRFLLNAFFPCLIFWGLLGVVGVIGGGWEPLKLLQAWNQQDGILKALEIIGLIAIVVFSASVLFNQSNNILRFYEGYWSFPLGRQFFRIGKAHHQTCLKELDIKSQMQILAEKMQQKGVELSTNQEPKKKPFLQEEMNGLVAQEKRLQQQQFTSQEKNYRYYPQPRHSDEVMPTRLGNILKNSEKYPGDRYNIDAVLVWSRLYHVLPNRYILIITEVRSALDFALAIATLSGLFGFITGVWLLIAKAPGWLYLLCFWGGTLVAGVAYQSAIGNAAAYAEQIKVGFDLYRHELIKQFRLQPTQKPDGEAKQWQEIQQLLYGGQAPSTWIYIDPDAKKEEASND